MNDLENFKPEIPDELIRKAVKEMHKERKLQSMYNMLLKTLGICLSIFVIIGVFSSIYRLEYYLELDIDSHYKIYLSICIIISFLIFTTLISIEDIHLISNYKKPLYFYIFMFFALLGFIFSYDFFIKEKIAKKKSFYKISGLKFIKIEYDTQKMCEYHQSRLYDEIEVYAMNSDSEKIIEKIFSNQNKKDFSTIGLSLDFNTYFSHELRNIDLKNSELTNVRIKISNGIVEISYPIK